MHLFYSILIRSFQMQSKIGDVTPKVTRINIGHTEKDEVGVFTQSLLFIFCVIRLLSHLTNTFQKSCSDGADRNECEDYKIDNLFFKICNVRSVISHKNSSHFSVLLLLGCKFLQHSKHQSSMFLYAPRYIHL